MGAKLKICLAVFATLATLVQGGGKCKTPLNLLFLLDKSHSHADFLKVKTFMEEMIGNFEIGEKATQVGLVYFAKHFYDMFCFGEHSSNEAELLEQLKRTKCEGCHTKGTNTGQAINNVATEYMNSTCGARPNAKNIVVVFTGGKATDPAVLIEAVTKLHGLKNIKGNTTVIAIGVGKYSLNELFMIASHPSLVFGVKQAKDLSGMLVPVSEATCSGRGKPVISYKIDLLFVVDYSGSVSDPHFKMCVQFLRDLIGRIDIGPTKVQVSLVLFGKDVHEMWTFNKYTTYETLDQAFVKHLLCEGCDRTQTNTAAALKFAREQSFTERCGARNDSKKFVVVFTDGHSTNKPAILEEEASDLKDSVDAVIAIGVGNADKKELIVIASHITLVFITEFDHLRTKETLFFDEIGTWAKKERKICNEKIDMLLVVDISGSVEPDDLKKVKEFLQDLVGEFEIGPSKVQVAVMMYAGVPQKKFCFSTHKSIKNVKQYLQTLTCSTCKHWQTKTAKALKFAVETMFIPACGVRPDAKKLTLVFTDGKSSDSDTKVTEASANLKAESHVVTIGVGEKDLGHAELKAIASDPKLVFKSTSFGNLPFIEKVIGARSCRVVSLPCPKGWTTSGTKCYRYHAENLNYYKAHDICKKEGGILAMPKTLSEQNSLVKLLKARQPKKNHSWVGMSDAKEKKKFVWADNTIPQWKHWKKGEPNSYHGKEDCVSFWKNDEWIDISCGHKFNFICQKAK